MNIKDEVKVAIIVCILIAVIAVVGVFNIFDFSPKNPDTAVGNTAGNLYNGGYFCEYEGSVYFSYPQKYYGLYRMESNGKIEFMEVSSVFSINVYGDYLYYARNQSKSGTNTVLSGTPYGIYRISLKNGRTNTLASQRAAYMCLIGNQIYFQEFDNDKRYFSKVGIRKDNKEKVRISESAYQVASADNGSLYYAEVKDNHNIYKYQTATGQKELVYAGNCYQPVYLEGYLYFIDLEDSYALKKVNMSTQEVTVLAEAYCINYNTDGRVVYYERENGEEREYGMYRCDADGGNVVQITDRPCMNINMTSEYTYFMYFKEEGIWYRTPTDGAVEIQIFAP